MQFQTPTIMSLMSAALNAAKARTELLLLLATLAGICSSIVYAPALSVIEEFVLALEHIETSETAQLEAATIFRDGAHTLLLGHLGTTAVSTFLLIPFARASAPGALIPSEGSFRGFFIRGMRSFLHMLAASGITMLIALITLPIVGVISAAFGSFGNVIALAALCLIVWVSIALTGTAHLAIAAEARDRKETLPSAFMRTRLFMAPIAGSLALILLATFGAYLTLGTALVGMLPEIMQQRTAMILVGAMVYLASALHVAALYKVPDFRDLRAL